jgi:hypothetical protein
VIHTFIHPCVPRFPANGKKHTSSPLIQMQHTSNIFLGSKSYFEQDDVLFGFESKLSGPSRPTKSQRLDSQIDASIMLYIIISRCILHVVMQQAPPLTSGLHSSACIYTKLVHSESQPTWSRFQAVKTKKPVSIKLSSLGCGTNIEQVICDMI